MKLIKIDSGTQYGVYGIYSKGPCDVNWSFQFYADGKKAGQAERGITIGRLLQIIKRMREAGYQITMSTK